MKPIEELSEILCTGCKGVEKDVKELRFGCLVSDKNYWFHHIITKKLNDNECNAIEITTHWQHRNCKLWIKSPNNCDEIWEIWWNPLSLKHLMMYCNEKGIDFTWKWFIKYKTDWFDNWVYFGSYELTTIDYNTNKELYEQEDKELLDIIKFLKANK